MKNKGLANLNFKWLLSALLVIFVFESSCLANKPLTEEMVLDSAHAYYPLIKVAQSQVRVAQANYMKAKGNFDPTIRSDLIGSAIGTYQNTFSRTEISIPISDSGSHFFTGYRIGGGNFPVYQQDRETYDLGEVNAGIEFPLFRDKEIDPRRAEIEESQLRSKMSRQEQRLVELQIKRDAAINYWIWYAEGKKLNIYKILLAVAQKRQNALQKSIASGDLPKADSYDNERLILQRRALVTNQQAIFQAAAKTLSLYYRDKKGKPIVVDADDLPNELVVRQNNNLKLTNLGEIAEKTPVMQKLKIERAISNVQLSLAKNNLLPLLNSRIYVAQDFGGGSPPLNRTSINYQLTFQWSLFQRSAKGQIEAAQAVLDKNRYEQQLEKERTLTDIQSTLAQLKAAYRVIYLNFKQLKLALTVQAVEETRFKSGESSLFILNEREVITAQTQSEYITSLQAYYIERANLLFFIGRMSNSIQK